MAEYKLSYTAQEVDNKLKQIDNLVSKDEIPSKMSELENDSGYLNAITPEMYGAVGDGVTDDSAAIQAAIDAAGNTASVYLAKKTYKISTGLILSHWHSKFQCDGEILYDGTDAAVTLKNIRNSNIYFDRITAENGTAIKLDGTEGHVWSNDVTVNYILSSVIGVYLYTALKSVAYNDIRSKIINSTETGVYLYCNSYYINDNRFHLGYIGGGCMTGIWLRANPDAECEVCENRFLSGSVEGANPNGRAICFDNSRNNEFSKFRLQENYGKNNLVFKGLSSNNDLRLSQGYMYRVDYSELTSGGEQNYVRSASCLATANLACGPVACVSYANGINYDPSYCELSGTLSTDNFPDGVIGTNNNISNGAIPTNLVINSATGNNVTYTLASLYSERGSLAKGFPIVFQFKNSAGSIVFKDSRGGTVLDNTDLKYNGKTVAVRWAGRDKENNIHVWDIKEVGAKYITETELSAKKYLTSFTETDPTVPSWAKASSKPSYTASEVGADASGTASSVVSSHNTSTSAHTDIRNSISQLTSRMTTITLTGTDDSGTTHTWLVYGVSQ